jgi:copper(I)-binding protein
VTAALVVGLPLGLSGCGASRDAQTYQERSQADATNTAVGTLALRGLSILPDDGDRTLEAGSDAEAVLVVTNNADQPDVLEEITTDAAASVEVLVENSPATLRVPALGSTGNTVRLRLVDLTEDLSEGQYATLTFRFRDNGSIEVPVPVAVSGRTDRPVYTGTEEEEPALQAPAGGHEEEGEGGGEGAEEDGEPNEGDLSEAEVGQDTDDEAPREDEAEEPTGGPSEQPSVAPSSEPSS